MDLDYTSRNYCTNITLKCGDLAMRYAFNLGEVSFVIVIRRDRCVILMGLRRLQPRNMPLMMSIESEGPFSY